MAARDKLIQHNLRLVAHIVKKYYAQPGGQEDFISIGTIGLIKAVNSFDNTKGARFATYASRCIENEIRMTLRSAKKTQGDVSLHEPLENDKGSGALTIIDVMADEQDIRADYERKEEVEKLRALVKTLSGREPADYCDALWPCRWCPAYPAAGGRVPWHQPKLCIAAALM